MPEADAMFNHIAQNRSAERMEGLHNVRSVYGAKLPRFGHYEVK
jgi:hypothetical protein